MNLIKEVEVAYFRSFYKVSLNNCSDLNVVFGKNDVGKSNIVRALSLFFNQETDPGVPFSFDIDFSDQRRSESDSSEDVRKFIYVKVTFNTPSNYKKSLGESFYVKRQWTVSRGEDFVEEVSSNIRSNQRHIVTRFLNLISFTYIPAIKDIRIFEFLLGRIYESISKSSEFSESISDFAGRIQDMTGEMFSGLPSDLAFETKISAPRHMDELFQSLDFETKATNVGSVKSLTLQRGDGVKVRHIPELLRFIAEKGRHHYHIWGFEEPENSLDFVSSEAEAYRMSKISCSDNIQMFLTTHSPSFYNLNGDHVRKFYVTRELETGRGVVVQGRNLEKIDLKTAVGDGFYLPVVAKALKEYSEQRTMIAEMATEIGKLRDKMEGATKPVLLTEGKTDVAIMEEAWRRLRGTDAPFIVQCCDTTDGVGGGAAGAGKLALCLKAVRHDSKNIVVGVFDRDTEGLREFSLDKNFVEWQGREEIKSNTNKMAHAFLLPVPEFRKDWAIAENLSVEFLFPDDALAVKIDGQGLKLVYPDIIQKVGGQKIVTKGSEFAWNSRIEGGKKLFAEKIVPNLKDEYFLGFEALFDNVEEIISKS
tara:strand:- start:304 stop:2076 length:1773 start_codon:yes stop_codon:yes gene_type:complete